MEMKIQVGYAQVLELVNQLPEKDIKKLLKQIQAKYEIPGKERIREKKLSPMQEIILQAPTWTDEDYDKYLEIREHINQSRLG